MPNAQILRGDVVRRVVILGVDTAARAIDGHADGFNLYRLGCVGRLAPDVFEPTITANDRFSATLIASDGTR